MHAFIITISKIDPTIGTFCDRQKDCTDPDLCCVLEPAVNPIITICKPALDEHQTCGPYNQFRAMYKHGFIDQACGPCKQDLVCKDVGQVEKRTQRSEGKEAYDSSWKDRKKTEVKKDKKMKKKIRELYERKGVDKGEVERRKGEEKMKEIGKQE